MLIESDMEKLIQVFPDYIQEVLEQTGRTSHLVEILMDLGRRPEARFFDSSEYLSEQVVSWQDLDYTTKRLGRFSDDNRAGMERTLHRISCIRNRQNMIIGLTCRIGRCMIGKIGMIRDLLGSTDSLLILGKPGIGKTTLIREISRVLSDEMEKRVVIVDTSNEIAGDGDIPHPGIGRARRMPVAKSEEQHRVMIEAVENHMPEVILIDEIGTELEALAARTIAERGVQLIGTAHGDALENLIKNPILSDLVGGIQYVTLSDEEAKRRGRQKTILERKSLATFPLAIELKTKDSWIIHRSVEGSVDFLLQGHPPQVERRAFHLDRVVQIQELRPRLPTHSFFKQGLSSSETRDPTRVVASAWSILPRPGSTPSPPPSLRIYSDHLSLTRLETMGRSLGIHLCRTHHFARADLIFLSPAYLRAHPWLDPEIQPTQVPTFVVSRKKRGSGKELGKLGGFDI